MRTISYSYDLRRKSFARPTCRRMEGFSNLLAERKHVQHCKFTMLVPQLLSDLQPKSDLFNYCTRTQRATKEIFWLNLRQNSLPYP